MEEISATIEETNAMRLKLGLKPLRETVVEPVGPLIPDVKLAKEPEPQPTNDELKISTTHNIKDGHHIYTLKDTDDDLILIQPQIELKSNYLTSEQLQPISQVANRKRKIDDIYTREINVDKVQDMASVKTFKKFKKSKKTIRENDKQDIEIEQPKKIDILDYIQQNKPMRQFVVQKDDVVLEPIDQVPNNQQPSDDMAIDTINTEMEVDYQSSNEPQLNQTKVDTNPFQLTITNFKDTPVFGCHLFLPKLAKYNPSIELIVQIKEIELEVLKQKHLKPSKAILDNIKLLEVKKKRLVKQQLKDFKPIVDFEYKKDEKQLTKKEAFKLQSHRFHGQKD